MFIQASLCISDKPHHESQAYFVQDSVFKEHGDGGGDTQYTRKKIDGDEEQSSI